MSDFTPIDHKDSDLEYRAQVLETIETILDTKFSALESSDELHGKWTRLWQASSWERFRLPDKNV